MFCAVFKIFRRLSFYSAIKRHTICATYCIILRYTRLSLNNTIPTQVKEGIRNPHELKYTEDGNVLDELMDNHPMVNFTLDFGVVGELIEYSEVELNELPRGCAAEA